MTADLDSVIGVEEDDDEVTSFDESLTEDNDDEDEVLAVD